jgi:mRNA-degrading endonuclease RelE of RelBE toxin-antitoxin system
VINTYKVDYDREWSEYFQSLDESIKARIAKKIGKILNYPNKRHLKKSLFFVDEVGQYRIIYRIFEEDKQVRFYFVGTHKKYEKWYKHDFK